MVHAPEQAAARRLALNARRLRTGRGLTQAAAAEKIGCSIQALQRLERAAANVTVGFAAKVAAAYQADVIELFVPAGPWRVPQVGRPPAGRLSSSAGEEPGSIGPPRRKRPPS
jgi:transcriptional regulator with XRE-family HTH domain